MASKSGKSEYLYVRQVRHFQKRYRNLSDAELRDRSRRLKYEVLTGAALSRVVGPAFGLVCEASRRTLGMVPHDVQILGGLELARQNIAEMKTGEGKTLTATLPTYLFALTGKGTHVATVNDYLADRDAAEMEPVYERLGLSVGVVRGDDTPEHRHNAYRRDVTYATAREIGFDFLRDRVRLRAKGISGTPRNSAIADASLLHRPFHFALVDEADSILIDEARTPLVIALVNQTEQAIENECFRWAAEFAPSFFEGVDYRYEYDKSRVRLVAKGLTKLRNLPQNRGTRQVSVHDLYRYMENAIKVYRDFHRDQTYAVQDEEVLIIDEFTGRIADGRQWQDGIQQAVQAKESVEITPENKQSASVTVQSLFRLYPKSAGMTGTAWTSRREFRKVYRKVVCRIPTHRPIRRLALPVRVFANLEEKWKAVVEETKRIIAADRPVLIGTRTVEHSEQLSEYLSHAGIQHQVLNARHHDQEAQMIACAGQPGRVTVATNMAGRGTDIKLEPSVARTGGLHVVLTEIHEAERIDWQLIGRGCRQGDPGSYRIMVCLEDSVLKNGLEPRSYQRLLARFKGRKALPRGFFGWFRTAQRRLERKHLVDRMVLLQTDKDRHQQYFEMGLDPFLYATTSSR